MAVKGSEGTINLSIFFVTTILTTTVLSRFALEILAQKLQQWFLLSSIGWAH